MNREIKFRGKTLYTSIGKEPGEWVIGSLLKSETTVGGQCFCSIVSRFARYYDVGKYEVDPKTVGQFTGLHDKNGKEIYRHDVIDWGGEQYLVEWDDDCSSFCLIILDGTELGYGLYKKEVVNIEVISNIHEEQFKHLIK